MASRTADAHKQQAESPRYSAGHLTGLRRFTIGITALTVLGHLVLGFEQSYAQPLVALATAYSLQLLLEVVSARSEGRPLRFLGGGLQQFVDFMLSAHIAGLAVSMLLYGNDRLWIFAFAAALAIGSKTVFRAPTGNGSRHFFNPSNFALAVVFTLCPWVGLGLPWQFTASLGPLGDWALPVALLCAGGLLNGLVTQRILVVIGFLTGFIAQAIFRAMLYDHISLVASLLPATGVAAILYTFFMVPDPATTPEKPLRQFIFGLAIGPIYAIMMMLHIVYGLFYALTIVCACRGIGLYLMHYAGTSATKEAGSAVEAG